MSSSRTPHAMSKSRGPTLSSSPAATPLAKSAPPCSTTSTRTPQAMSQSRGGTPSSSPAPTSLAESAPPCSTSSSRTPQTMRKSGGGTLSYSPSPTPLAKSASSCSTSSSRTPSSISSSMPPACPPPTSPSFSGLPSRSTSPRSAGTLNDVDLDGVPSRTKPLPSLQSEPHTIKVSEDDILCEGKDYISDTQQKSTNASKKNLDLFDGIYTMGPYKDKVMIKKTTGMTRESDDLLKTWAHPNAISRLDSYTESGNMGRCIIPPVDDSFTIWFMKNGRSSFFNQDGKMSILFRTFIIDMCGVLESLQKKGLKIPGGIVPEDIYIILTVDKVPKFRVLVIKVESSQYLQNEARLNWQSVKELVDWCCRNAKVTLDPLGRSFANFLTNRSFNVKRLKLYPDIWDWSMKGDFLMALKIGQKDIIKRDIINSRIQWPHPVPIELEKVLESARKLNHHYSKNAPYDYLVALWDSYKHFQERRLDCIFGDHESFLAAIDRWTPNLWIDIYEQRGWPLK